MAGRTLGEAWVTISPDTAGFRADLDKKLETAMTGLKPTVKINVRLSSNTALFRTALMAQLKNIKAKVDVEADNSSLAKTDAKIKAATRTRRVKVEVDIDQLQGKALELNKTFDAKAMAAQVAEATALNKLFDKRTAALDKAQAAAARMNATLDSAALQDGISKMAQSKAAIDAQTVALDKAHDAAIRLNNAMNAKNAAAMASMQGQAVSMNVKFDARNAAVQAAAAASAAKANTKAMADTQAEAIALNRVFKQQAVDLAAAHAAAIVMDKGLTQLAFDAPLAASALGHLQKQAASLSGDISKVLSPSGITVGKIDHAAFADLSRLQASLSSVRDEMEILNHTGVTSADDVARVSRLKSALGSLSSAVAANGVTVSHTAGVYRGWVNALVSVARIQIPLFNGAFTKMLPHFLAFASGTHMMTEAVIETIAVWIPAAVALTTFGAAAYKTGKQVYSDVMNMHTAAIGTGQAFAGMAVKAGKSLSDMAKPYVYTAYGLALEALAKKSTTTGQVIQNVGSTIDRWISEAVIAYTKGTGKMALMGSKDFAVLGDSFKQLGTIFEAFVKMTPGYAEVLLKLGDGFLHLVSAVLNNPLVGWFGALALKLHGAFFYLGLATTLFTKLGMSFLRPLASMKIFSGALNALGIQASGTPGKFAKMGTAITAGWQQGAEGMPVAARATMTDLSTALSSGMTLAGTAVKDGSLVIKSQLINNVGASYVSTGAAAANFRVAAGSAMTSLRATAVTAASGIKGALGGMFSALGISPFMAAAAAVGGAILLMRHNMEGYAQAAQNFAAAADTALGNTTGIQQFGSVMSAQLGTAQKQLITTKKYLNEATADPLSMNPLGDLINGVTNLVGLGKHLPPTIQDATAAYEGQKNAVAHLVSENQNYQANLAAIAKANGVSIPQALALTQAAGISTTSMMQDQGTQMAENVLMTKAAALAYSSLTSGIGGVKTAYSALNIENSSTMQSAQSVASAFANYTSLITGGASAFDNWSQGETELNSNIKQTGDIASTVTLKLGKFSDKIAVTGKGLDGTSAASIAANQAFLTQVNNSQALYGQLIQLAAASGDTAVAQHALSESGKDMISTLLKTAGGSKSAMTQVYALAQTFGYAGKSTLPGLVTWLGRTGDKTKDLQTNMNALTGAAGNLGNAAKALSGDLSTGLQQAEAQSIIDAKGGAGAFTEFAKAVENWSSKADPKTYNAMIKAGGNLKSVFIDAAGSASAALPSLEAYMMQLGAKNQAQAKQMAEQILGVGGAASLAASTEGTASASAITMAMAHAKLTLTLLKAKAAGVITSVQMKLLTAAIKENKNQVDVSKTSFVNFATKLGIAKGAADKLWGSLKDVAGNYAANVDVKVTGGGSVNISDYITGGLGVLTSKGAAAQGKTNSLIHRATGGKIPGWHNTGDNLLASSPGGPVALQGGEAIVPKNLATHPAFTNFAKNYGIPGFSGGGLIAGGVSGDLWNGGMSSLMGRYGEPKFAQGVASQIGASLANSIKSGISAAGAAAQEVQAGVGGGVARWKPVVDQALGLLNLPSTLDSQVLRQISTESGGNAQAINLSDSNAAAGDPSRGLLQTIMSTFQAYHVAGTSENIYDPLANVAAAINYALHRYGPSLMRDGMGLGSGHGYAKGGKILAFGASTTSGTGATAGYNYVDDLSRALAGKFSVENEGIVGNELTRSGSGGPAGEKRFQSLLKGIKAAIVWEGNDDISAGISAPAIIRGYQEIISEAHAKNVSVVGGTLQAGGFSGQKEAQRQAVNRWILSSKSGYDAVADVDRVLRDPAHPNHMANWVYNQGQHHGIHPGDAGYAAVAGLFEAAVTDAIAHRSNPKKHPRDVVRSGALTDVEPIPPHNQVDVLTNAVTTGKWVNYLTSQKGSISPFGWAMQPALGDLMLTKHFAPPTWEGKPSTNQDALLGKVNFYNAQDLVRQYMNSVANQGSMALAGRATGIHGRDAQGRKFKLGGMITEQVEGRGVDTGMPYTFHANERIVGANQVPGTEHASSQDAQILLMILAELQSNTGATRQQGREMGKALNGNVGRKLGRG